MTDAKDCFDVKKLYTCKGKGGQYQPVDTAKAAGTLRNATRGPLVIYYDINSNELYVRTERDFLERMEVIE